MRWSCWKTPLVLTLAWTGLAWAQYALAPSAARAAGSEHYLMVGDPPQKCRVLASWRMDDGRQAYDVQALDTGEVLTLYEAPGARPAGGGGLLSKLRMRIAHWGQERSRPAGFPAPPACASGACSGGCASESCSACAAGRATQGCPSCACGASAGAPVVSGPSASLVEPPLDQQYAPSRPVTSWASPGSGTIVPSSPAAPPYASARLPVSSSAVPQSAGSGVPLPPPAAPGPVASAPLPDAAAGGLEMPNIPVPASPNGSSQGSSLSDLAAQTAPKGAEVVQPQNPRSITGSLPSVPLPLARPGDGVASPSVKPAQPMATYGQPPRQEDWRKMWGASPPNSPPAASAPSATAQLPPAPSPVSQLPPAPAPLSGPSPSATPPSPVAQANKKPEVPLPTSRVGTPGCSDPFALANQYTPPAVEKKLAGSKDTLPPAPGQPQAGASLPGPGTLPAGTASVSTVPLGMQSVLAASNGLDMPTRYMPVPIVTVPQPTKPPTPPVAQLPTPPLPTAAPYPNAFSPADGNRTNGAAPNPMAFNAFTPANAGQAMPPLPPPGQMAMQQAGPGYLPYGYYPPPGMMPYPPAYANPMAQAPYANNALAVASPAALRPAVLPPGVVPTGYQAPGQPVPYANPAMDRPGLPVAYPTRPTVSPATAQQMVGVLRTSLFPSQREWAAGYLASLDWRTQPQVLPALLGAAKEDPAPSVRLACIHNLARMNANPDLVTPTFQALRSDADQAIRQAAEEALSHVAPGQAPGIQPVGAVNNP
jgi:hypothetical protein